MPSARMVSKAYNNNEFNDVSVSKIAFLSVKQSENEYLESLDEFMLALQHAGYNPSQHMLRKYWRGFKMSYQQFCDVVDEVPLPNLKDYLHAFKSLNLPSSNLNVYRVSRDELLIALTSRGDKLPLNVVRDIVDDVRYRRPNGQFDCIAFCQDIIDTSEELLRRAQLRLLANPVLQSGFTKINSNTYRVRRRQPLSSSLSVVPNDKKDVWQSVFYSKGSFYFEGDNIISHQYSFILKCDTNVRLLIQIKNTRFNIDYQLFVFKSNSNSDDSEYKFLAKTPLSLHSLKEEESNSAVWTGFLVKGRYLLVPFTSGCFFKRKVVAASDTDQVATSNLVTRLVDNGKVVLTNDFRQCISEIFAQIDLDNNGSLSRQEFNLFNWKTSGEEVQDEEWKVVEENFALENGELDLCGFLQLHQMEAEDNCGDSSELWVMLQAMGYNSAFIQDEASHFQVMIAFEKRDACDGLRVSGLKSGGSLLDKAIIRHVIESPTNFKVNITNSKEIFLYRQDDFDLLSSFVLQNESCAWANVFVDFSGSLNVALNHPYEAFSTRLAPKSSIILAYLVKKDVKKNAHSIKLKHRYIANSVYELPTK